MPSDEGMRLLRECHAMLTKLVGAQPGSQVASDQDLDGRYGDGEIKKDPPRWKGDSHVGRRMSECDPAFLDVFADFKAWAADRDEEKAATLDGDEAEKKRKYAHFGRLDASRARGWAARLRSGWKSPNAPSPDANPDGWE